MTSEKRTLKRRHHKDTEDSSANQGAAPADPRTPNRMRRAAQAGIATAILAGTVVAGVGVADSAMAAPTITATTTAATTKVVDAWSAYMPSGTVEWIPQLRCPDDAPFLIRQDLSPGRIVPRGVEVIESGWGIGVTIPHTYVNDPWMTARGSGGYAAVATNWNVVGTSVLIRLHCTNDREAGYWVAPDSREWGDYGS